MNSKIINNKPVYIVDSHHEVLEAWEIIKPKNVFCLDYHADSKPAFQQHAFYKIDGGNISNESYNKRLEYSLNLVNQHIVGEININNCIGLLQNSEFIDFAVRANIIERCFIFGCTECNTNNNNLVLEVDENIIFERIQNKKIFQYTPNMFDSNYAINDYYLSMGVNKVKQLVYKFFDDYVLDIDLDYFNTVKSINPENVELFSDLIKKAKAITIARECEWVNECKVDDEINCDYLLTHLECLIYNAM